MKVKDIMTKNVASLNPEDTVEHAAQLMKEYNIGSLPVCNEEKVIGIITDRDIAIRSSAEGENVQKQTVRDIMTSNPVTIKSDIDIQDATRIMSERQIRRLPVVESNNLVGMLSLGDVSVESASNETAGEALSNISEPSTPLL
ncbi:CBS domain-containing protein [Clostridium pascui]|uniref:CBS domain-containing protein n=1 Tax=Clostridium pascui TaxID=46609 RepID=UPI001957A1EE|nr:CBS domain-containing protein [Clostridium pascui]MBM7870523.1 CBS domain-containing protein [Clostridium pascui]